MTSKGRFFAYGTGYLQVDQGRIAALRKELIHKRSVYGIEYMMQMEEDVYAMDL